MRRFLGRLVGAVTLAAIPAALGLLAAVLYTSAGHRLLGRLASEELTGILRGRFTLRQVRGSFLHSVEIDSLSVQDTLGQPFADIPRVSVRYALPSLLAGRIVLTGVVVDRPRLRVIKRANGRLNFQEILRLGEGGGNGGPGPLIEFRDLQIRDGRIELLVPWSPPDTVRTPAQAAAALAADRARPGRVILETPEGLRRLVVLDRLSARFPVLRASPSPLTLDVDSLTAGVSDPAVHIADLAAHVWTHDDSLAFTLHRAALAHTRAVGGGVLTWPEGPVRYDFALEVPTLDLADLHWISPDFPDMTGHARVVARTRSSRLTAYAMDDLDLAGREGRIRGRVTALTDNYRGLGVENMDVRVTDLNLDVPRPYLDTLPLEGTITGALAGSGFRDGLDLDADLDFQDARVPGGAANHFSGQGHLVLGGAEGPLLDTLNIRFADLDLRTVAVLAPAVKLRGRGTLVGALHGPWHDVTFDGVMTHQDDGLPQSRAEGSATLDTRGDTVRFDTRVNLNPLVFDGIRPSYPGIPVQGAVSGTVALRGSADRFRVDAAVRGDLGALRLDGVVAPGAERLEADSLEARFSGLDLARLRGTGPHTLLTGSAFADGVYDTLVGPRGRLQVALGRSTALDLTVDTLVARLAGEGSRIRLDTLAMAWEAGRLDGAGRLGWRQAGDDHLGFQFQSDSLSILDPLVSRYAGAAADSVSLAEPLHGSATGEIQVLGSLAEPRILVTGRGEAVGWRGFRAPELAASFGWNGTERRPEIGAAIGADTAEAVGIGLQAVNLVAGGYVDSLRWSGSAAIGDGAGLAAGGQWWSTGPHPVVGFDSLVAHLPTHDWRLLRPARLTLEPGRYPLTDAVLEATDGSGSLTLTGAVPNREAALLTVNGLGLSLRDVYTLLQRDTAGVSGTIQLDLALAGTAASPTLNGTAALADLSFGDFGSPFVQGIIHYADRRLDANLLLWKTGEPVLRVEAGLPLDLALRTVPRRQVEGPLTVRAIADSTDLVVAEAFTRNLRRVRGTLRADVQIEGSWDAPRLDGFVELRNASAQVPGLGVSYSRLNARARLSGDSIALDSLVVRSGEGDLRATGGIRLERLTRPLLNLSLRARRFRAIDVRSFLTLDASGTLLLTGPVLQPHLTGRVTADQGDLHFADLLTKRIVDLENPGDSGLIDLNLVRTEKLGANFQSRFLDSLAIDTLQIRMGESFWLRSSEANIQLDGALTVNKVRDQYRYDGTLNAVRGNYALRIGGLVTRDFTVERGTVRYFGTPDLNADLDIEARHTVIAAETGEEIPIIAKITGTMLQPKLELQSPPTTNRPALSQTELVSYLMFGRPTFSLVGQGGQGSQYAAVQAGLSYLSSALSSEIQRSLISDLGVPIDYLDIRPGSAGAAGIAGQGGAAQVAQVAAGWQIGRRWFVQLVADLCTNTQRFYPNAEFRVSRQVRLKASVEPAYSCQVALNQPALSVNKYQVGLDVLWEREY